MNRTTLLATIMLAFSGCGNTSGLSETVVLGESALIIPATGAFDSRDHSLPVETTVAPSDAIVSSFGAAVAEAGGAARSGVPTVIYASVRSASLGANASLNGSIPFSSDNPWNTDISQLPVDPKSSSLLATIGLSRGLKSDFGSGLWNGAPIGIPYVVVSGIQPKVPVRFTAYPDESDSGPYPIPFDAPVEGEPVGQPGVGSGDRHVIVIDRDNNRLYETFASFRNPDGSWRAANGAVFHLDSNIVRPTARPCWTSADAAGLPIFPGLVRYDEASTGVIRHALRFTVPVTRRAYVPPATHWASTSTDPNLPPMGMRVRLKANYMIPPGFSTETRAILQALKTYGMLLADNGGPLFISGAPDYRWNNPRLNAELSQVKAADLEVVRMDGLVTP